jgi:hypothetical protein
VFRNGPVGHDVLELVAVAAPAVTDVRSVHGDEAYPFRS